MTGTGAGVTVDAVLAILADAIPGAPELHADTELLASGLLDSLALLEVVDRVEHLAGVAIPAHLVTPETFRTAEAVCQALALSVPTTAPAGEHA